MGLLDLFRGKKQEQKVIADVRIDNLGNFINEKKSELSNKEKEILSIIRRDADSLVSNLEEKINVLENIDLNKKKVDERVKLIVKENLFYFTSNLKKLIINIRSLEADDLTKFIEELNKKFFDFEKKSLINYEKATFIIGKELGDIKESISVFFREMNKNLSENKDFFDNLKVINISEAKLKEVNEFNDKKKEIRNNIEKDNNEISELKKENEMFEKSIDKIKKSDTYKEEIDNEIILEEKNKQYEKELSKLREMLNFKALTNAFHSNEKFMSRINYYKNDFKDAFESDGQFIVNLIKEAGIPDDKISEKISKLIKDKENLENLKKNKKDNEIRKVLNLQSNIRNNTSEIESFNHESEKEDKLIQKFNEVQKKIIDELRSELIKINVNLVE